MVSEALKRPRKSAAEWAQIRVAVEAGDTFKDLARKYHVTNVAISVRAKREGWKVPLWERKKKTGLPVTSEIGVLRQNDAPTGENKLPVPPDAGNPEEICHLVAIPKDIREALDVVLKASPEEAQQALGRLAQVVAISGATSIPGPRTVQEFKVWVDLWRKLTGLDQPAPKDAGGSGLLGSMRTVTRRSGPVLTMESMEAETVETRESGSPAEDWSMDEMLG